MTDEVSLWRVIRVTVVTAFLAAASSFNAAAQQGAEREAERDRREELTLEERVAALERAVASLDTRLDARTVGRSEDVPAPGAAALEQRVAQLERTLAMLRADIDRIARTADTALRTATDAQRTAAIAEREARNAASRF